MGIRASWESQGGGEGWRLGVSSSPANLVLLTAAAIGSILLYLVPQVQAAERSPKTTLSRELFTPAKGQSGNSEPLWGAGLKQHPDLEEQAGLGEGLGMVTRKVPTIEEK